MNREGLMRWMLLAVLGLAGCTTVLGPSIGTSAAAIRQYQGQPVSALVARLGHPHHEEKVMGSTVYTWGDNHETDAVCVWKATVDGSAKIIDTSVYGNPIGCDPGYKQLKR